MSAIARPATTGTRLDGVTGQAPATEALRRAIARDEVGHAFLFVGPGGVGQDDLVALLAAGSNCPNVDDEGRPCGTCSTCTRILRGTHPNMVTFVPVGAAWLVESVRREWIPATTHTLVEGNRRVIHVTAADRMNEAAQNAFLKVLEEPPPSTVWVLQAQSTAPLLDTIVSRCRRLDLQAWSADDLGQRARELGLDDRERVRVLARAAQGSPTRLAEYVHDLWQWTCPACDEVTRFHGVVQARWPTHCTNRKCKSVKDGEPASLVASPVDQTARQHHLRVIARFRDQGAVAVGLVAKDVMAWADARVDAVKHDHEVEKADLVEESGVKKFSEVEAGVRTPTLQRHKREVRAATLAAVTAFLDDFGSYLRDLVAVASGAGPEALVNLDAHELLLADVEVVPVAAALRALAELPVVREALVVHSAQPQLQVERLLMPVFVAVFAAGLDT